MCIWESQCLYSCWGTPQNYQWHRVSFWNFNIHGIYCNFVFYFDVGCNVMLLLIIYCYFCRFRFKKEVDISKLFVFWKRHLHYQKGVTTKIGDLFLKIDTLLNVILSHTDFKYVYSLVMYLLYLYVMNMLTTSYIGLLNTIYINKKENMRYTFVLYAVIVVFHEYQICGSGARFGKSCYQLVTSYELWEAATAHCDSIGHHMLTITSAEENRFVTDLVKEVYGTASMRWCVIGKG